MKEEIILTITMLVSDREDTIEKCLNSILNLMKAISSELIVVDTAGNEKCMEIVRRYTDKIVRFKWCDDFAAARNAGLRKAKGKWVMFLDDDEWFEDTTELEEFFQKELYLQYKSASYFVRNYLNKDGSVWKDSLAMRLAKREKTTQFVGRIHECLSPLEYPMYQSKAYAHHYGYAYESEEEKMEHSWRNIQPLLAIRKEQPDDYHAAAQLVQEYMGTKDYFAALQLIRELRNKPRAWNAGKISYTSYMCVREMEIYRIQERFQEAYEVGKEILNNEKILLFVRGCLLNQMVAICYRLKKYEEVHECIKEFQAVMEEWKTDSVYERQDLFRISETYILDAEVDRLLFMKLHVYGLEEEWEKAGKTILNIDWKKEDLRLLVNTAEDIVKILAKAEYDDGYIEVLKRLVLNFGQQDSVFEFINKLEEEENWKLLFYIYKLPLSNGEICKYHILYAGHVRKDEEIRWVLEEMRRNEFPVLLGDYRYWKTLKENQISLVAYTKNIRVYEWLQIAERLMENFTLKESEDVYLVLIRDVERKDIRFLYLTSLWMEKRLLEGDKVQDEWKELYNLALYWSSCGAFLYKEDVFMGDMIEAIPPRYQFAWYILQANSCKGNNSKQFIRKIADAAKAYSPMKELCKNVIKKYTDEDNLL